MDVGTALLWVGLILAVGSAAPLIAHLLSGSARYRFLARLLVVADFAAVTAAFLLMVYAFLAGDLSIAYVHSHTKTDYPWPYRLSGVWSGDVGSILLWAWLQALVLLGFALGGRKDTPSRARVRAVAAIVLLAILAAFLYALIAADPFRPTPPIYLISEGTNTGTGMSPVLLTPLVIVHPPLEFIAYALISVPFAAALAYLLLGRGGWAHVAMQWTRAAWLFLTLAILVGALWAYTTLGWGGYWSWDPVETANLVVWLPLTGLVHAQLWSRRKRQFPHLTVLLATFAFAFTMLATFETRTGIVVSVHSFTPAGRGGNDLASRLLSVLAAGGAVPWFYVLMVAGLLATAAAFLLFFLRIRRAEGTSPAKLLVPAAFAAAYVLAALWVAVDPAGATRTTIGAADAISPVGGATGFVAGAAILAAVFVGIPLAWLLLTSPRREEGPERDEGWVSDDGTMLLAVALFLLWGLVTLGLMLIGANSLDPSEFEARLPFLLVPVGLVLFAALSWRLLGRDRLPYVLLVLGLAIVASYVLFSSNLGGLYFPLALALLAICIHRMSKSWAPALLAKDLRLAAMLTLGSLLLAFVMWGAGATEIRLLVVGFPSSLLLNLAGVAASVAGIVLLAVAISRHDWRLWLAATGLGIVLVGFLVGIVLAAVSLALQVRSRSFDPGVRRRAMSVRSILRASSPPLIHFGVALVVLGYAASSYFYADVPITAVRDVSTPSLSGYEYRLLGSGGRDPDGDGAFETISAEILVSRGGVPQFTADLSLVWRAAGVSVPNYLADAFVHSHTTGDLALTFIGFSDGTRSYDVYVEPGEVPVKATSEDLTSVEIQVKESPLMVSLWSGGWLMAVGMGARMWSERGMHVHEVEEPRPARKVPARPAAPAARDDEYYRRQLERELGGEGR